MIQCKVLKQLENLEQQKYDDEDISEDIKFLLDKLGESVQDLRCLMLGAIWIDCISGWPPFNPCFLSFSLCGNLDGETDQQPTKESVNIDA